MVRQYVCVSCIACVCGTVCGKEHVSVPCQSIVGSLYHSPSCTQHTAHRHLFHQTLLQKLGDGGVEQVDELGATL
eukprot:m.360612 g.360612  ORF g.360612 m.360612 type:complete len:75 (-) comp19124_c0_seq1:1096-1320(-)